MGVPNVVINSGKSYSLPNDEPLKPRYLARLLSGTTANSVQETIGTTDIHGYFLMPKNEDVLMNLEGGDSWAFVFIVYMQLVSGTTFKNSFVSAPLKAGTLTAAGLIDAGFYVSGTVSTDTSIRFGTIKPDGTETWLDSAVTRTTTATTAIKASWRQEGSITIAEGDKLIMEVTVLSASTQIVKLGSNAGNSSTLISATGAQLFEFNII